jgi:3-hydroxyisobutyrate dehydrogenase
MGKTIKHVGGPGAGHAVKALNNYVSAAGLVAAAEALIVGQAFGLDPAVMTDVFNSSTGRNNSTENKLKQFILSGRFDAGFSLRLMDKDLATAFKLAQDVGQPMELGRHLVSLWHEAAGALPPQADHTEIFRYLERK